MVEAEDVRVNFIGSGIVILGLQEEKHWQGDKDYEF